MHKAIVDALSGYPFEFQLRSAYGYIDGFEVNYTNNVYYNNDINCQFSAFLTREKKLVIINRLHRLGLKKVEFADNAYGITYTIKSMSGLYGRKIVDMISQINEEIVNGLKEEHALDKDYSPLSGQEFDEVNSKVVTLPITGFKVKLLNEEIENLNAVINDSNQKFEEGPNNYFRGFFGILIGAIAGVALMAFLSFALGIISAWAPILSVFLGTFLYKKFGGKPTWVMIIMVVLVNLIAMLGFTYFIYQVLAVGIVTNDGIYISDGSVKEMFNYCMTYVDGFKASFTKDMLITLVFCIVSYLANIYEFIRSLKRVRSVK